MARLEEIIERIDRRLEELLEESTRLQAALETLAADEAPASRRLDAGRTPTPRVKTRGRSGPVKPRSRSARSTERNAVGGDDGAQDTPVERAVRQLRQELGAGLRG